MSARYIDQETSLPHPIIVEFSIGKDYSVQKLLQSQGSLTADGLKSTQLHFVL